MLSKLCLCLSSSPLNTHNKKPETFSKAASLLIGQMNARAYVLIFFFWAVLAIVTPTLILLSESSKADFDQNGKLTEVMKPRKMMVYFEKHLTPDSPVSKNLPDTAPSPAPGPAPAPAPSGIVNPALRIQRLFRKQ